MEIAAMEIALGKNDSALVIGAESMSNTPNLILNAKKGSRMGPLQGRTPCSMTRCTAPWLAIIWGSPPKIWPRSTGSPGKSRTRTRVKATDAPWPRRNAGLFDEEMIPVEIAERKGTTVITKDAGPAPTFPWKAWPS
jgi:acetyl-CoA acetyltransferase